MPEMNIIQAVNDCLRLEMRRDQRVVVLGELAVARMWKGDSTAAEHTAREALRISRERLPQLHPDESACPASTR